MFESFRSGYPRISRNEEGGCPPRAVRRLGDGPSPRGGCRAKRCWGVFRAGRGGDKLTRRREGAKSRNKGRAAHGVLPRCFASPPSLGGGRLMRCNCGMHRAAARRESRVQSCMLESFGRKPMNGSLPECSRQRLWLPPYLSAASLGGETAGTTSSRHQSPRSIRLNCLSAWERFGTFGVTLSYESVDGDVSIAFRLGNDLGPDRRLATARRIHQGLNCLSAWERFGTMRSARHSSAAAESQLPFGLGTIWDTRTETATTPGSCPSQLPFGLGTIWDFSEWASAGGFYVSLNRLSAC